MSGTKGDIAALEQYIGYTFSNSALLETALTHTSFVKGDGKGQAHNERLEYLGDAVLELCITEQLFFKYPTWSEGALTRARASIVCEAALYEAARRMELQRYLRLGHGEDITGGRDKPSILSDALEAVIGAIYIDGGFEQARAFVLFFAQDAISCVEKGIAGKDDKSALQEYVQKYHLGVLQYRLTAVSGPDHKKEFQIRVFLNDQCLGEGTGGSKQEAGQNAAREALRMMHAQEKPSK